MRKKHSNILKFTFRFCWKVASFTTIALGLGVFLLWLVLPRIASFQAPIEARLSETTQNTVNIGSIHSGWHGLRPYIGLNNVHIIHPKTGRTLFNLKTAEIEVDLIESIRQRRLMQGEISLIGFKVQLRKDKMGTFSMLSPSTSPASKTQANEPSFDSRWLALLGQQEIIIKSGVVQLLDELTGQSYIFKGIEGSIKHDLNNLQLRGYVSLPYTLGNSLAFFLDVSGDISNVNSLAGMLYLKGNGLNGKGWGALIQPLSGTLPSGRLSPELWLNVKQGKVIDIVGKFGAVDIATRPGFPGYSMASDFYWEPTAQGWALHIKNFAIDDGQYAWPATTAKVTLIRSSTGNTIEVGSNFFRLEDAAGILAEIDTQPFGALLNKSQPQGDLKQLYAQLITNTEGNEKDFQYTLHADFERLGLSPFDNVPGFSNVSGRLQFTQKGGVVHLDTRTASLDHPNVFRDSLSVSLLKGRVEWQKDSQHWTATAKNIELVTPGIQVKGGLQLKGTHANASSTFLNMALQVGKGNLAHASQYLPAKIMKPALVQWMDQALKGGEISHGNIVFRGALTDFPFKKNNKGRFGAVLHVHNGLFSYAKGWPKLHTLNGSLLFSGARFDATLKGGVLNSDITMGKVSIKDMTSKRALVKIQVHTQGSPQDGLEHLTTTPLRNKLGSYGENIHFTQGLMKLSMNLSYPLRKGQKIKLKGSTAFENSVLTLKTARKPIDIKALNGVLTFTETDFFGKNISASIMELPAEITVETQSSSTQSKAIIVSAEGEFSPHDAARITGFPWNHWLTGSAHWVSTLAIHLAEKPSSSLSIVSDMRGIRADFPQPFAKSAAQKLPLTMAMDFTKETSPWQLHYGALLSGEFILGQPDSSLAIKRAIFSIGDEKPILPDTDTIRITGKGDAISWDQWSTFLASWPKSSPVYQEIDVNIQMEKADIFQRRFSNIHIKANKQPTQWAIELRSEEVAGAITVPANTSLPLNIALDRLHLTEKQLITATTKPSEALSPNDLSLFVLDCKDFSYNGMKFGKLSAITSKRANAMVLDHLETNTAKTQVTGKGQWVLNPQTNQQKSSIDLIVNTQDAASTLREWQYTEGIDDGEGEANIHLQWAGSPRDFSLATIKGNIDLQIKDGRLLDIEPGVGRVFGLLSLQSFSKRLSLDFSDIFNKGFSFDTIKGQFSIHNSHAYSDNFYMEGSAARVDLVGRVGLVAKDYDQLVTVTPQVSSSLPMAGILAGGLGVGAAVFVIQKIFKPQIDKIARTQYAVTGPWDNPVFLKLHKKKEKKR